MDYGGLHRLGVCTWSYLRMLPEAKVKITAELASVCFFVTIVCHSNREGQAMSYDKRYVAQKRQRRRRKTAKAKVKLYEQGKIPHDKLPSLAKKFLTRKLRALSKTE
jgi:hypothetical protein